MMFLYTLGLFSHLDFFMKQVLKSHPRDLSSSSNVIPMLQHRASVRAVSVGSSLSLTPALEEHQSIQEPKTQQQTEHQTESSLASNPSSPTFKKSTPSSPASSLSVSRLSPTGYVKNVFLGTGLVFMERLERLVAPVVFLFRHFGTFGKALLSLSFPALVSWGVLTVLPSLATVALSGSWLGYLYLGGLYITSAFFTLSLVFIFKASLSGFRRSLDHLAQKGQEAFAPPSVPLSTESELEQKEQIQSRYKLHGLGKDIKESKKGIYLRPFGMRRKA